jgi:glutaredoxin
VKEFLSQKGVPFTERNVSLDPEARRALLELGYRGTPVTVIKGRAVLGANPQRLEAALQAAGGSAGNPLS